jgi:hypothetical protein
MRPPLALGSIYIHHNPRLIYLGGEDEELAYTVVGAHAIRDRQKASKR